MRHITFIVLICKNYGVCNILLPKDHQRDTIYSKRTMVSIKRNIKIYVIMCYGFQPFFFKEVY